MSLEEEKKTFKDYVVQKVCDGELSQNMNTRVPSEPRYNIRKKAQSQQQ